jgi:hypothetical protein
MPSFRPCPSTALLWLKSNVFQARQIIAVPPVSRSGASELRPPVLKIFLTIIRFYASKVHKLLRRATIAILNF